MEKSLMDLAGKIALVTGSTSYIGESVAVKLAGLGATVIVNGRNRSAGERVVSEILESGSKAHFEQADLMQHGQVQDMVDRAIERFERIDILVASGAGASNDSPPFRLFEEMGIDDFDLYIRSHWLTRAYVIRAVYPHMKRSGGGKIVAIGTDAGRVATVGESFIGGSTAGMMQMTRVLAREFGRHNVRINNVSMSYISDSVPRWGQGSEALVANQEKGKGIMSGLLKRMLFDVQKNDVAETVAFLASPASDSITGQTLSVNGGLSTPG